MVSRVVFNVVFDMVSRVVFNMVFNVVSRAVSNMVFNAFPRAVFNMVFNMVSRVFHRGWGCDKSQPEVRAEAGPEWPRMTQDG